MLWVMVVALLVALWSLWLEPLLKQRTHWQAELHGCRRSSAHRHRCCTPVSASSWRRASIDPGRTA